ncbi:MAG: amidohydrolase family protein [Ignavibacteria bacterium]|nr:amidohydrolase family protein [Ignavibacteria bacterium]
MPQAEAVATSGCMVLAVRPVGSMLRRRRSVTPGKLADLAILSKNLLSIHPREYLTTEVLYTIVDGRIVYARER